MPTNHASQIVARLGPATVALDRADHALAAQDLALAGCRLVSVREATAAAVGLVRWRGRGDAALAGLVARAGFLAIESDAGDRLAIDGHLFASGWSRHPGDIGNEGWAAASGTTLPPLAFYKRGERPAGDALGRGDPDADALLTVFARAAETVRAGDEVVVVGEQAMAGAAVLGARSRAISISAVADAASLAEIAPHTMSVVLLVTVGAAPPDTILILARRALRPDGRLLLVWSVTASGIEPVRDRVDELFISEGWLVQRPGPAGGSGMTLHGWTDTAVGDRALLIASANPLLDRFDAPPFTHPAFPSAGGGDGLVANFAGAYRNPWLYRVMVQIGERLGDEVKLARLAECVLDEAAAGSADRGAAITVLGYRVLDRRLADAVPGMIGLIEAFLGETAAAEAPHLLRWRLSLLFLAGRLTDLGGDADAALDWYGRAATADWQVFSPLLATKAIAARYHAARLLIAAGEHDAAMEQFRRGLATALAAAAAPHEQLFGDPDRPLPFYMTELAEVIDMGAQCANALAAAPLLARDAGLFWQQVDVKRFGLFAWADALSRENSRLRGS